MITTILAAALAVGAAGAQTPARAAGDVTVRQVTYKQLDGTDNHATLVLPAAAPSGPRPAVLFVHWYEPPRPSSNRTEFLADAIDLASRGTVSLLIDTPWSAEKWFNSRDGNKDYDFSIQYVKELRHALDVLLQQPSIDKTRVAYVGHDFGAMYGAAMAAEDSRITHLVYMAGDDTFSEWFLFTPKREGADRDAFIAKFTALDPVRTLARVSPRPVLLQFGTKDKFVSEKAAKAQADAISGPKLVKMYEFEHELTAQARADRLAWLREQFKIKE